MHHLGRGNLSLSSPPVRCVTHPAGFDLRPTERDIIADRPPWCAFLPLSSVLLRIASLRLIPLDAAERNTNAAAGLPTRGRAARPKPLDLFIGLLAASAAAPAINRYPGRRRICDCGISDGPVQGRSIAW